MWLSARLNVNALVTLKMCKAKFVILKISAFSTVATLIGNVSIYNSQHILYKRFVLYLKDCKDLHDPPKKITGIYHNLGMAVTCSEDNTVKVEQYAYT